MLRVRRDGKEDAGGRGVRGGLLIGLRIEEIYGFASLQGAPRPGRRPYGVPPRGAFDEESLALANALVGNNTDTLGLELALATLVAAAEVPLYCATVGSGGLGAFQLNAGDRLTIRPGDAGARCYVAVKGGWIGEVGVRLEKGALAVSDPSFGEAKVLAATPTSLDTRALALLPGPGAELGYEQVIGTSLRVRMDSDRVGVRLEGLRLPEPPEQLSEPTVPGAVQITRDGSLIILGPDGPTIGGYPVVGYVASTDLDKVGQLRPGAEFKFSYSDPAGSATQHRETRSKLHSTLSQIKLSAKR